MFKAEFCGDALSEVVHGNVSLRYVDEFRDAGMRREYAEVVQASYSLIGTVLAELPSLVE